MYYCLLYNIMNVLRKSFVVIVILIFKFNSESGSFFFFFLNLYTPIS